MYLAVIFFKDKDQNTVYNLKTIGNIMIHSRPSKVKYQLSRGKKSSNFDFQNQIYSELEDLDIHILELIFFFFK